MFGREISLESCGAKNSYRQLNRGYWIFWQLRHDSTRPKQHYNILVLLLQVLNRFEYWRPSMMNLLTAALSSFVVVFEYYVLRFLRHNILLLSGPLLLNTFPWRMDLV